jgi:PAS domain S-box-containing protein
MPAQREAVSYAPPVALHPRWIRRAALALVAIIFWADLMMPLGAAVPVLYVAPTLLFVMGGRFWEPILVAAASTMLVLVGAVASPEGGSPALGAINRPLGALTIWFSAGVVAHYRRTLAQWSEQYAVDRAARERSLQQLEEMRYALDQAAIVATTDAAGTITSVNHKFTEISQYTDDELIGQTHRLINSRYHPPEFFGDLWKTISGGKVWRGEIRNRAKDGSFYWVDTTIVPFLGADGRPWQYLAIRSDVTARKKAEARLAEQAALAQLGQLAAVVAHEVRNPLAGVKGTLQVLRSRASAEGGDRAVMDAMIARLDVLNTKVEDILRFARPRAPVIEAVDVRPVLCDVARSARAAVGSGCPEIVIPESTPTLLADREMLRDVLLNLLLNACQSGSESPVEVLMSPVNGRCAIEVADRGSGFDGQDPERLFQAFHTTKKSGTGLGLAIVRRLVSLQDGSVALVAREGGGTIARVELPVALVAPSAGA